MGDTYSRIPAKNRSLGWQNVWNDESDSGTLSRGGTANCGCNGKHRKNIFEKLAELTAAKCDFLLNKEIMEDNDN